MGKYPFDEEEPDLRAEISFLEDYICSRNRPGSHEIVEYVHHIEKLFEPITEFLISPDIPNTLADVTLDKMTLRYFVKYLELLETRIAYVVPTVGEIVEGYDFSEEAIAPVLEPEWASIWCERQKRFSEIEGKQNRIEQEVLARIAASKISGGPKATTRGKKRRSPARKP